MPKPVAPVVDDDPVVVSDPEPTPKPEPVEEIDLNAPVVKEPTAEEKIAAKVKEDLERLYTGKLSQVENRLKGAQRINTTLQQKISALEQKLTPASAPTPQSTRDAELQALVDKGDWQTAVAKVASAEAEKLYLERTAIAQRQAALQDQEQALETSKSLVTQRYPDLDPEMGNPESEVSRAYTQILNQDPRLLSNPYGPEIAMYRMEQALAQAQNGHVSSETARQQRLGQTGLAPARPVPSTGKVTIDREEKEFIDYHGIDPKTFAKIKQSLAQQGGVEA